MSADSLRARLSNDTARRFTLPNGLTVIHKADYSAELASVQVWIKTGSIHEGAWLGAGLSHFLEHMLFKGTATRGPLDISREVQSIGGYINAYTSFDRTVYYIDTPSESAGTAFDLLGDMTLGARLPEDTFVTERDVILREIAMGEDDPDRRTFQHFALTTFREHPFRHPVIGWKALFEKVTHQALCDYYQARYVPNNAVLVVVGALSDSEVRDLAEKHFGKVERGVLAPVLIPEEPPSFSPRRDILTGDVQIERGLVGYRTPGLGHDDLPALEVLALELGHGQSSRLWQELREKRRLVHYIDASCWTPGREGMLWMSYGCDPGKHTEVEAAIDEVIDALQSNWIASEAVRKAVNQSIASEVNSRKTMTGQASRLGGAEVVLGDMNYPMRHLGLLEKVDPSSIQRAACKYIVPEGQSAVALVPVGQDAIITAAKTSKKELLRFEEETLTNGARLLCQQSDSLPKAHLRFACLGGPLVEPAQQRGVTGVLASMLVRDTEQRTAAEVASAVESAGGSFSEFIGNNTFGFSLEVLPNDLPLALDLLDQALNHLKWNDSTFEVEREGQIASIREDEDEILEVGRRLLRDKFFGEHPYAVDYMGRIGDLNKINIADVVAQHKAQLIAPQCVLAVSGAYEDSVILRVREILAQLPSGKTDKIHHTYTPLEAASYTQSLAREQAVVLRAYPDVGTRSKDYIKSELLDELFSGMSSELFNKVREEKGLAYYVGSGRAPGLDCGMFNFYAGTQPGSEQAVLTEINTEIARVASGSFKPGEIEGCKLRLSVKKRQGQQALGSRAMQAALNALYGLPVNAHLDYEQRLNAISHEQLAEHAKKTFDSAHAVEVLVGPDA